MSVDDRLKMHRVIVENYTTRYTGIMHQIGCFWRCGICLRDRSAGYGSVEGSGATADAPITGAGQG
jgi:hypothetical protein